MAEYNRKQNTSGVCAQASKGLTQNAKNAIGEMLIHVFGKVKSAFFVSLKWSHLSTSVNMNHWEVEHCPW